MFSARSILAPLMMAATIFMCAGCATTVPAGADRLSDDGDAVVVIRDAAITINDSLSPGHDQAATMMWVRRAGQMVENYFGHFSVPDLHIDLITGGVSGVSFGIHYNGRRLRIFRGLFCSREELTNDWVLLHEMLHTAYPMVDDDNRWMREGLSTYLETIIRAQAGVIDEQAVWSRFVRLMPQGLPQGGRGLVESSSWANLYWGGALFWLLADVRIREATAHRAQPASLQDALRSILAKGGTARRLWKVERILDVGDEATGTHVLHDLYQEMALAPIALDTAALWKRLGIQNDGNSVMLVDTAPSSAVRRAMTLQRHTLTPIPQ